MAFMGTVDQPTKPKGRPFLIGLSAPATIRSPQHFKEPIRVVGFAAIESKRLFVEIAKQMERLNADIRAADGPL